jgi:hypothetical protein
LVILLNGKECQYARVIMTNKAQEVSLQDLLVGSL